MDLDGVSDKKSIIAKESKACRSRHCFAWCERPDFFVEGDEYRRVVVAIDLDGESDRHYMVFQVQHKS